PKVRTSAQIHDQKFWFRHLLNRVAQTFASQSGIFNAAIGHVVDAEGGNVAGDQASDFEFVVGLKDELGIAGKKPGLQAVGGTVDLFQRGSEIAIGLDGHNRRKDFLAIHFHVGLGAGEYGGFEQGTFAVTAAEQARPAANRLLHPVGGADGVAFPDERANVARLIERISGFQLADSRQQQLGEFSVDGVLDQDALHGNTGLSRVSKAAGNAAVGSVSEIGVAVDDDPGIASQFENNFLLSRVVLDGPADGGAAREADELDALIGDQQAGIFVGKQNRVESAVRPARLLDNFSQQQRGKRRLGRGLEHHGTAGGDRWSDFVRDQVQGKIEGRNPGDRAQRKTFDDAPASGGRLLPIQRQIFAVAANRFFRGNVERKDGTVNFHASALDGLARFQRNRGGKLFFAIVNADRDLAQHSLALEGGQPPGGPESLDGSGDGGFRVFAASLVDVRDEGAVVGRAHVDDVTLFQPLPVQEKTVGRNRSHRHLGHAFSSKGSRPMIIELREKLVINRKRSQVSGVRSQENQRRAQLRS